MKRTHTEANGTTAPAPQKEYITLARECISAGNIPFAVHYLLLAQGEIATLTSQISLLTQNALISAQNNVRTQRGTTISLTAVPINTQQHVTVPPSSVPNAAKTQQAIIQSSTAPGATGTAFYDSLNTTMESFFTLLKREEYSEPYSKLNDALLVDTVSKNLINFMQGKNAFQLRALLDKLRDLTKNLVISGVITYPKMTKNHYILKHLQWAAYFHLVRYLLSIDPTPDIVKLALVGPRNSLPSQDYDFPYRNAYIALIQNYFSSDKFSLKHPLLLAQACTKQDLSHIRLFTVFGHLVDHNNESEMNIFYCASNAFHQLYSIQALNHHLNSNSNLNIKVSAMTSLESIIQNSKHNDLTILSLRAIYTILSDECSREIKSTIAGTHHFADAHNAKGSIAAFFFDAMARIYNQAGDLIIAKQYAISALEKCKEHNIELPPKYKLHAIARIAIPALATNASDLASETPNSHAVIDLDQMLDRNPNAQVLDNFAFDHNVGEEVWLDTTASSAYSNTQTPMTPSFINIPDINTQQFTQEFDPNEIDFNSLFS